MTYKEMIDKLYWHLPVDFEYYLTEDIIREEELRYLDDVERYLEEHTDFFYGCMVTYYTNAMKFLMEHDTSLQRSMEIASDLGYDVGDLDSEKLANLLAPEVIREDFWANGANIREFLNEFWNED